MGTVAIVVAAKGEEAEERAVVEVEVVVAAGVAAAAAVAQHVLPWSDGPRLALGTPVTALVRPRRSRAKNPVLPSLQPPRWLHAQPFARLRLHSPLRPQLRSTARGPDVHPRPSAGKVDEQYIII